MPTPFSRRPGRLTLAAGAVALAILAAAVHFGGPTRLGLAASAQAADDSYYTCPMHPQIVQDEPGSCPICGMDLVVKKSPAAEKHQHAPAAERTGASQADSAARTVTVDPVMVQNMGVRVAQVQRGAVARQIRTIGEVDVAEDEISVVNLRFSGWVERIYADQTGQQVKRGQWLFSIYSPELVAAQKEYLLAHNTRGADSPLTRSAAERLRLWDIPASVLDTIIEKQNVERNLIIKAPRTGYILHKKVVAGARVEAGQDLYRIGNLKKIWVTAEVYEFDAPWVELGQPATMELSFQRGRQYRGQVGYIYPTLNPKSRTLKVRLEFDNPGVELKPGMFATVRIEARRKEDVLHIPTEAVIHSGQRDIVFVARGLGKYEPRQVVTGLVGSDHSTEVLSGLRAGETVVTSGQFLLDSESQLQEAVQKLMDDRLQAQQERAGSAADANPAARDETRQQHDHAPSYWTCPMHPQIVQDEPGSCPICGMDLVEKKRTSPQGAP
jgi:Cu(I)/Ag(I) efflux system membrane fusion protein/cobalt-zinc-cadmium efflux system membrane fusion protein